MLEELILIHTRRHGRSLRRSDDPAGFVASGEMDRDPADEDRRREERIRRYQARAALRLPLFEKGGVA